LYIRHSNGFSSVYGHLNRFIPEIDQYVKNIQYENREFEINVFPLPSDFPVRKGELVAYSGNTGYSFGPHLHFEIRESENEIPVNPLFHIPVADTIPPVINSFFLYPLSENSYINYKNTNQYFPVSLKNGIYKPADTSKIIVTGSFGIAVETYDLLNGSNNKCGIYSIKLLVNDSLFYMAVLDNISFGKTRYINSYIDFEEKLKNKRNVHKLFIDPNNKLDVYLKAVNNGILHFLNDSIYNLKIEMEDVNKNESCLEFDAINATHVKSNNIQVKDFAQILYYSSINEFVRNDIKILFPENCFYTDIKLRYAKTYLPEFIYSPVHHIHDIYTPVHNKFKISIKPENLPGNYSSKLIICTINNENGENEIKSIGGEMTDDGYVVGYSNTFGKYVIMIDSVPPAIKPVNFTINKNDFTKIAQIEFKVEDDFSKIRSYNGFIDGKWVLFEYNYKDNILLHKFDEQIIEFSTNHKLELIVQDEKNNYSRFTMEFYK